MTLCISHDILSHEPGSGSDLGSGEDVKGSGEDDEGSDEGSGEDDEGSDEDSGEDDEGSDEDSGEDDEGSDEDSGEDDEGSGEDVGGSVGDVEGEDAWVVLAGVTVSSPMLSVVTVSAGREVTRAVQAPARKKYKVFMLN